MNSDYLIRKNKKNEILELYKKYNNESSEKYINKSFYPLDLSNTTSKEYKLYLQYKGLTPPSQDMKNAFKNASVSIP